MKKREQRVLCNQIRYIGNPAVARLGKRVAVRRIGVTVYDAVRSRMRDFLKRLLANTVWYAESRWRKSIAWNDVRDAVVYMNRTVT
jgi:histone H3/H4